MPFGITDSIYCAGPGEIEGFGGNQGSVETGGHQAAHCSPQKEEWPQGHPSH